MTYVAKAILTKTATGTGESKQSAKYIAGASVLLVFFYAYAVLNIWPKIKVDYHIYLELLSEFYCFMYLAMICLPHNGDISFDIFLKRNNSCKNHMFETQDSPTAYT